MIAQAATAICTVFVLLLPPAGLQSQGLPGATAEHGAFAFPDPTGRRLLVVSDLARPDLLHEAACSDGRRFPVRFERRQIEREGARGRQSSYVFDSVAGSVFTVPQGTIGQGSRIGEISCFLASDALRSSATWLSATRSDASSECSSDVRRRLASSRSRPVGSCWPLAALPGDRRVVVAEFARRDKDALASVVLIDRDRTIFADYPATFTGEGQDLWRADDGGVLVPEGFRIVFVLQRGHTYVLGVSWAGAEGQSLAVFVSKAGNRFTQVISDYWYQAPD
jgi:hypothetical protein